MAKSYLTIAFILAGSSVVAARFVSDYLPPFTTTFLSLICASLTAILIAAKSIIATSKKLTQQQWFAIILQALFGSFLFRIFLTMGLQYTGTTEAGIIIGASPAITALLTWFILRERLGLRTIVGIFLTFGGIMLVQGFPFAFTVGTFNPLDQLVKVNMNF